MSVVIRMATLAEVLQRDSQRTAVVYTFGLDLNSLDFDIGNLRVRKETDATGQFTCNVGSFAFQSSTMYVDMQRRETEQ
jgi:hypothetical protein